MGPLRGTPGDDEQIAGRIAFGNDFRNILRDAGDFFGADADHVLVVERLVIDVAGDVLLFDAADAVFEAGSAGNGPGASERFRIALIRLKAFRDRFRNAPEFREDLQRTGRAKARRHWRDSRRKE